MLSLDLFEARPLDQAAEDYAHVQKAIAYLTASWKVQPSLGEIAGEAGLTEQRLTQVFRRWAGLTPKAFLQALTIDHARTLLRQSASVLEAAYEVGLSGPGRLHDLFVTHEAMSPGEYKSRGAGIHLAYGFHQSPFGEAIAVATPRGLAGLGWVDEAEHSDRTAARAAALEDMRRRWPQARFQRDDAATAQTVARIFSPQLWRPDEPLRVVLIGSDFEVRVWETLLRVPLGKATTYSAIAGHIGKPRAHRRRRSAAISSPRVPSALRSVATRFPLLFHATASWVRMAPSRATTGA